MGPILEGSGNWLQRRHTVPRERITGDTATGGFANKNQLANKSGDGECIRGWGWDGDGECIC